jgi:hypothetical protein
MVVEYLNLPDLAFLSRSFDIEKYLTDKRRNRIKRCGYIELADGSDIDLCH